MRAVVFAYHDVGVNCLQALLDAGIQVDLVITHTDDPNENIWFASVVELCKQKNIPYLQPQANDLNALLPRLQALQPDYIFSFYYRYLIPTALLACARIAALNMHGSLLPKYRGRAPINWAILHGETETGATLHIMEAKPDAGEIVGQQPVNIGTNDTATEVFARVSAAAVQVIQIALPQLLTGQLKRLPNPLEQGSYFGGRKPADGKVDWSQTAQSIHNLIRAVAPPIRALLRLGKDSKWSWRARFYWPHRPHNSSLVSPVCRWLIIRYSAFAVIGRSLRFCAGIPPSMHLYSIF